MSSVLIHSAFDVLAWLAAGLAALWLGRVKMRGRASGLELDQEFAIHSVVRDGKFILIHTFLSWREGLAAVGLG